MRGGRRGVDLSIYWRALPYLVRNPSILAMPLLAAVVDMLLSYTSGMATDPLGGLGSGIFGMISQIIYLFAFGVAIIQGNNIARGYHTKFDDAWEEARRKAGGIILAAIGFQFIVWVASYAGSIIPIPFLGIVLQLAAYFFLILVIPAAAIGGLPGGLALSGSIRAVRANVVPCLILAVVFVLLWIGIPELVTIYIGGQFGFLAYALILALARAIVLAYMAFPFATTYDDIAFKLW
ncbi:MAG TPA: hypothetical protein VFN49_01180 [Candidatus Aquilonibacter sp.]|nr:hypothetical protein [Candidatus Aquilonibacter sp.]